MFSMLERVYSKNSLTYKAIKLLPSYKAFRETYNFLQKSQWWSREQLETYQLQKLGKLLKHAYENVPYYRRVFDERGLKPEDIQDFSDLQKLPYLTKDVIRKNINDLKARNYPDNKFEYVTTSGTTSGAMSPLGFYYEKGVSRAREWAFIKTQWDRIGYHFWDKCAVLRGYVSRATDKSKFFDYSLFGRWLILSPFLMSDKNLSNYIDKLREFEPKYIQAFPSEIYIIAKFMKENDIDPFPSVKALLCGSENLYEWQRKLLEGVFDCRVYCWYGHAEQAVLAGECEVSSNYHIFPEYGIVELVDSSDKIITSGNKLGEIVATGLNNDIMPLIRYRTMDLARISDIDCECRRNYRMITQIEGRLQEMIIAKDKRLISVTAILAAIKRLESFPQLKNVQFVQEKAGLLKIKIVKGSNYSDEDENEILTSIDKNFRGSLKAEIEYVDHIPTTVGGKHMFLIQKLDVDFNNMNSSFKV